jgi:hypothetical protein
MSLGAIDCCGEISQGILKGCEVGVYMIGLHEYQILTDYPGFGIPIYKNTQDCACARTYLREDVRTVTHWINTIPTEYGESFEQTITTERTAFRWALDGSSIAGIDTTTTSGSAPPGNGFAAAVNSTPTEYRLIESTATTITLETLTEWTAEIDAGMIASGEHRIRTTYTLLEPLEFGTFKASAVAFKDAFCAFLNSPEYDFSEWFGSHEFLPPGFEASVIGLIQGVSENPPPGLDHGESNHFTDGYIKEAGDQFTFGSRFFAGADFSTYYSGGKFGLGVGNAGPLTPGAYEIITIESPPCGTGSSTTESRRLEIGDVLNFSPNDQFITIKKTGP